MHPWRSTRPRARHRSGPRAAALALLPLLAAHATAARAAETREPSAQAVVVTATRIETPPFELPASIDRIDGAQARDGRAQVNISESLAGVAGLQARERQNYAQDVQISVRGFGARSTFGIRGVRLYVDGIPATLPDGQGQLSNVDLGSADRIEVLRGPFSALYGNSSGGVIQVFTEDGNGPPTLSPSVGGGSDGATRVGLKLAGAEGTLGYVLSASQFETDGYRQHSAARRRIGNVKLQWKATPALSLGVVANSVALPLAMDPLGLTRAQWQADPRGVDPSAETFNTRKTVEQAQLGATAALRLGEGHALHVLVYGGHRGTTQFQSIPVATQANPLHPGGVIQLGRDYGGTDLRWTLQTQAGGRPLSVVAGVSRDTLSEHRTGRQNFVGTTLGVEGAVRRDEDNRVRSLDGYLQANWRVLDDWVLNAGLRRSRIRFASADHYVVGTNPDDSGAVAYGATLPALGVAYAPLPSLRVYATAGRGFETPTLNELAYRADGQTGLNLALQAARSRNVELGIKTRIAGFGEGRLAWFHTTTQREIVTLSNVGGRSSFTNAGATRRRGWEASWALPVAEDLQWQSSLTLVDATYVQSFLTCTATPCAAPSVLIAGGNRIPGIAKSAAATSLQWTPAQGWRGAVEARASGRVPVNDVNSDAAPGHALVNLQLGYALRIAASEWTAFGRVDNLFARRYAGSVIVNEGNGRYFEPAPRRTWLAGLTGSIHF